MSTVRTDVNPGEAVRQQMIKERRLRENRRQPATVVSEEAAVEGASPVGGPNPNDEFIKPARIVVQADSEPDEPDDNESDDSQEAQVEPSEPETQVERPNDTFGSKGAWRAYRLANGYTEEELEGLGRDNLRDLDDR